METDEFDTLALKSKKADEAIDEAIPKGGDISKGIKQLKKQLKQAVKDDDYTKAAELSTKIQTLIAAVPELEEEPEKKEPEAKEKPAEEPEAKEKPAEEPEAKTEPEPAPVEEPVGAGVEEGMIEETTTWEELGWQVDEQSASPDLTGWKIQDAKGRQFEITETDEKGLVIQDGDGSTKRLGYLGDLNSGGAKLINPQNEVIGFDKRGNFVTPADEGKLPVIDKDAPDKADTIKKLAEEKDAKAKARKEKVAKAKKEKVAKAKKDKK